jgi:anti-sigma28 factor (negative regulator of flagellin synthesis)
MNRIDRISGNIPVPSSTAKPVSRNTPQSIPAAETDSVQLSAQPLSMAFKGGEIRQDKVASIRQQLEDGTYDENSKVDSVVDKLLNIFE